MDESNARARGSDSSDTPAWDPERAARILRPVNATILATVAVAFATLALATALTPATTWLSLLLAPGGVAVGGLLGFVYATLSSEKERFGGVISTINGAIGGAAGADLLRGDGLLATTFAHLARACGMDHASLAALVLSGFAAFGFIAAYTNKKLWINWQQATTDQQIRAIEEAKALKAIGVGGAKSKMSRMGAGKATVPHSSPNTEPGAAESKEPDVTKRREAQLQLLGSTPDAVDPADPEKGKWGGSEVANGRRIVAQVRPSLIDAEVFSILVRVTSVDATRPLIGDVVLHLHPTFSVPVVRVPVVGGVAEQQLLAWGSFTVGAEVIEPAGTTALELDLATIADAPEKFRSR